MKAIWAILCKNVIVDQQSNNVSLIEVIDEFTIPVPPPVNLPEIDGEPGILLDVSLVVLWARSHRDTPEKAQSRTSIVTPDGTEARSLENEVDLTEAIRARAIGRIVGFPHPLNHGGEYLFRIELKVPGSDWKEELELPLWVNVQKDTTS